MYLRMFVSTVCVHSAISASGYALDILHCQKCPSGRSSSGGAAASLGELCSDGATWAGGPNLLSARAVGQGRLLVDAPTPPAVRADARLGCDAISAGLGGPE